MQLCAQDHEGKQQLQQVVAKELEVNKPQQQASVFQVFVHSLRHGHFGLLPEPCMCSSCIYLHLLVCCEQGRPLLFFKISTRLIASQSVSQGFYS